MHGKRLSVALATVLAGWMCWAADPPTGQGPSAQEGTGPALAASSPAAPRRIGLEEFERLRLDTNAIVLDVRTPAEYAAGHAPGARNLNLLGSDFEDKVSALDRSKPYLVYCARGNRSARAVQQMQRIGFRRLYDFGGGWAAWQSAGKPAER